MKKLWGIFLVALLVVSCSSQITKEIRKEEKQMPEIDSNSEMVSKMRAILEKAPNLTAEQKSKFIEIHDNVYRQAIEINHEIRKLKIILFRSMVAKKFDDAKVANLTGKIKALYGKKLDIMLDGMGEIKNTLGVNAEDFFSNEQWRIDHMYPDITRQPDDYRSPGPSQVAPLDSQKP